VKGRIRGDLNIPRGQATFISREGVLAVRPPKQPPKIIIQPSQPVTCPYCLFRGQFIHFRTHKEKGRGWSNRCKCPDCGEGMLRDTLTTRMNSSQHGCWLYRVARAGAFPKIHWEKLKARLKARGTIRQFWDGWHEGKKASVPRDYGNLYEEYVAGQVS